MESSLVIENLTAGYGKVPILKKINLSLQKGSICALMGENGSGKTTLIRCINATLKPLRGKVWVKKKALASLNRMEIARLISVVPQATHSAFSFTCMEMILMGAVARMKPWSAPGRKEVAKAMVALEEVGGKKLADRLFNRLSGGERQLVMIARALYQDTPIMLLDEPNTHLDYSNQHSVMELIRRLVKRRNVTALITLHDPNLALFYCDRVAMLKQGEILALGKTKDIMNDGMLRQVLGSNIQCGHTENGVLVVTPRHLGANRVAV
ncbi:MAG: ABC transporter ATP-binding protein [Desulfobacterium sp.]|nr:ABC transporter ATP-binding protein [Desulfobacterium sp.]